MKFGKQLDGLKRQKFEGYYIQYKDLKKAIKVWSGFDQNQSTVEEVTHWTSSFLRLGPNVEKTTEARLLALLDQELNRISKFADLQSGALRTQLESLEQSLMKGKREDPQTTLNELSEQLVQLREFAQLNYTGFRKILKKYDKFCKSAASPWFMTKVARASFMTIDYDSLVLIVGRIATLLRKESKAVSASPKAPDGPQQELVFLVNPNDSLLLKVQLATLLDLQVAPASRSQECAGVKVKSVFLDSSSLSTYQSYLGNSPDFPKIACSWHFRLYEGENATLVCTDADQGRTEMAVPQADLTRALAGESTGDSRLAALTQAVQASGLQAMAQAAFIRYSFYDGDEHIIATLDEHVRTGGVGENATAAGSIDKSSAFPKDVLTVLLPPAANTSWLDGLSTSVDLFRVPNFTKAAAAVGTTHAGARCLAQPHWYNNIFKSEIESTPADFSPDQLSQASDQSGRSPEKAPPIARGNSDSSFEKLSNSPRKARERGESFNVAASSRYQHEYEAYVKEEPAVRHVESTTPASSTLASGLSEPLLLRPDKPKRVVKVAPVDEESSGFLTSMIVKVKQMLCGKRVPTPMPIRSAIVTVQPKTLFSNERTFLEWIHFSTMFAGLGILSLHVNSYDRVLVQLGRGLVLASIFLIAWALRTFSWRVESLNHKEIREYHDPVGPPVLIFCLIFALVCASAHALLAQDANVLGNGTVMREEGTA